MFFTSKRIFNSVNCFVFSKHLLKISIVYLFCDCTSLCIVFIDLKGFFKVELLLLKNTAPSNSSSGYDSNLTFRNNFLLFSEYGTCLGCFSLMSKSLLKKFKSLKNLQVG